MAQASIIAKFLLISLLMLLTTASANPDNVPIINDGGGGGVHTSEPCPPILGGGHGGGSGVGGFAPIPQGTVCYPCVDVSYSNPGGLVIGIPALNIAGIGIALPTISIGSNGIQIGGSTPSYVYSVCCGSSDGSGFRPITPPAPFVPGGGPAPQVPGYGCPHGYNVEDTPQIPNLPRPQPQRSVSENVMARQEYRKPNRYPNRYNKRVVKPKIGLGRHASVLKNEMQRWPTNEPKEANMYGASPRFEFGKQESRSINPSVVNGD